MKVLDAYSPINRRGIRNTNDRQDEDKNRASKEQSKKALEARRNREKAQERIEIEREINYLY